MASLTASTKHHLWRVNSDGLGSYLQCLTYRQIFALSYNTSRCLKSHHFVTSLKPHYTAEESCLMNQGFRGPQNKFVSESIVEISKLPPISIIVNLLTHMTKDLLQSLNIILALFTVRLSKWQDIRRFGGRFSFRLQVKGAEFIQRGPLGIHKSSISLDTVSEAASVMLHVLLELKFSEEFYLQVCDAV
jgi:hypothetical protein